jgi:hypothetical protein
VTEKVLALDPSLQDVTAHCCIFSIHWKSSIHSGFSILSNGGSKHIRPSFVSC